MKWSTTDHLQACEAALPLYRMYSTQFFGSLRICMLNIVQSCKISAWVLEAYNVSATCTCRGGHTMPGRLFEMRNVHMRRSR